VVAWWVGVCTLDCCSLAVDAYAFSCLNRVLVMRDEGPVGTPDTATRTDLDPDALATESRLALGGGGRYDPFQGLILEFNVLNSLVQMAPARMELAILLYLKSAVFVYVVLMYVAPSGLVEDHQTALPAWRMLLGWAAGWLLLALKFFRQISMVNMKFTRLPTILNGMDFGSEYDPTKTCLVAYVMTALSTKHCGFLIYNVFVTNQTFVKTFYYSLAVVLSISSRLLGR